MKIFFRKYAVNFFISITPFAVFYLIHSVLKWRLPLPSGNFYLFFFASIISMVLGIVLGILKGKSVKERFALIMLLPSTYVWPIAMYILWSIAARSR